ncbi:MAG: YciI family protein [Dongiaceae bacterium]
MLFAVYCVDKADGGALRAATRPTHLAYLESQASHLAFAGPLLAADGTTAIGSLLVVDYPDRAAVDAFAAGDPYAKAGLFARVEITGWRQVYPKG